MADEEKKETAKKTAPKKAAAPRRTARTTRAKAAEVKAEEPKTTASDKEITETKHTCLLYTSPSPRDRQKSRMPSSA